MTQKAKKMQGWDLAEQTEYFKFVNIGDMLQGVLLSKERSEKYNVGLYTIRTPEKKPVRFLGKQDLDDKLTGVEIGREIHIELVNFQETEAGQMQIYVVHHRSLGQTDIE